MTTIATLPQDLPDSSLLTDDLRTHDLGVPRILVIDDTPAIHQDFRKILAEGDEVRQEWVHLYRRRRNT
jgi:hypothetical protein